MYKNLIKQKEAFSLAEVLISIIIVGIIAIIMAPVITKKMKPVKTEGVIYTYQESKLANRSNNLERCFQTELTLNNSNNYSSATNDCSEYTFVVPDGVDKVNLTLVAGGGGGGGASGGYIVETEKTVRNTTSNSGAMNFDLLKEVKVNLITGDGTSGGTTPSSNSNRWLGGSSGTTSAALHDFIIPKEYMRGYDYKNTLATSGTSAIFTNQKITYTQGSSASSIMIKNTANDTSRTEFGINNNTNIYCALKNTTKIFPANSAFYSCMIPPSSISERLAGKSPTLEEGILKNNIHAGDTVYGRKADKHEGWTAGTGGDGASFIAKVNSPISPSQFIILNGNPAQKGITSISYTSEYPGQPGGGGGGGTMLRITNFPVTPGSTYYIYVGRGGAGGINGMSSTSATNTNNENGKNGKGGVSTAIYNSAGSIVYLVKGGAGGGGGTRNTTTSNYYNQRPAISARHFYKAVSSSSQNFNHQFDTDIISRFETTSDSTGPLYGYSMRSVIYNNLNTVPFNISNYSGQSAPTNARGGFSNFYTGSNSGGHGMYYRTLIGQDSAYVGGLGGFSGLGGKAGCGGYFAGDGDKQFRPGSTWLNISDYFDNCSLETPDGQSAVFVMPDPFKGNLGQAGAGGGGGGYSISHGPGKGGRGQDGYLMIDWRK